MEGYNSVDNTELRQVLRYKIMNMKQNRMCEHGKTVVSTKEDEYKKRQEEVQNDILQKELLKKEKEKKRQKEKKKRQKMKKKIISDD